MFSFEMVELVMCDRIFGHKCMMKHTYETEAKIQEQSIKIQKDKI